MKDQFRDPILDKLVEDSGSPELANQLLPFVEKLINVQVPPSAPQETQHLLNVLHYEIHRERINRYPFQAGKLFWLILESQLRVVKNEIWLATLMVMALGIMVTFFVYDSLLAIPFVISAPVIAAIGIAFIYGTDANPALEIELSTPISPRVLLLARLTLIFGFDLMMGLLASAIIVRAHPNLVFWSLVTAWLAPMAFLSALSFLSTVLSNDPGLGILVSLGSWAVFNVVRLLPASSLPLTSLPFEKLAAQISPFMWMAAFIMIITGLWLAGNVERQLKETQ